MKQKKSLGIYIHIPFCLRKCRYCDFLSFAGKDVSTQRDYVEKVVQEIGGRRKMYHNEYMVNSIYIGGGTPSLLPPVLIEEILDAVYSLFPVAEDAENTMEINPGTSDRAGLKDFRSAGISRLSMGLQSFDAGMLAWLGRIHQAEQSVRAYEDARKAGFSNVNLDLMFGMPGETMAIWKRDLRQAIALAPEHLSFYSLQVEEGTAVYGDIMEGRATALTDVEDRLMYHYAVETLTDAGYGHYEISNAARPGFASRHNLKYWSMEEFLGIGLGAHSYMKGRRFANTEDWNDYMTASDYRIMTSWIHRNTVQENISEYVFLGLRKTDGIDLKSFRRHFGRDFWEIYSEEAEALIRRGLLVHSADNLRLTSLGLDLSNQVFMEFV
jgi:oxygen-independent coproporphyrinogen-3 oxidase